MTLGRAIATVGGFTLLSRIFGFVRDIVLSAVLGSGAVADAFFVAFKLPNFFRRLFAEGAFSAAFVPMFARELQGQGRDEALTFARQAQAARRWTVKTAGTRCWVLLSSALPATPATGPRR